MLQEGKTLVSWDEEKAKKAIKEFCNDDNFVVDPAVKTEPPGFSQYGDSADFKGYPHGTYRWPDDSTDHITDIMVQFPDPPYEGCNPSTKFKVQDHQAICEEMLGKVIYDPDPCESSLRELIPSRRQSNRW